MQPTRSRRLVIGALCLFSIIVAALFAVAENRGSVGERRAMMATSAVESGTASPDSVRPHLNPLKGSSVPDFAYYMTINAMAVSLLFMIGAVCAFILRRPDGPGGFWLANWTAALLAFWIHLHYGVNHVLGSLSVAFHDPQQPPRVINPYGDSLVTVWWTLDVLLAWVAVERRTWMQVQRGVLTVVLFGSALVSAVVLSSNDVVRLLGVLLLLSALSAVIVRIVVYPFDPRSASGRLYTLTFQCLNYVVIWYRLPTWFAVFNLGALRIVLRRHNLVDTSSIPVTNQKGLATIPPFDPVFLTQRNLDGFYNDLGKPTMGSASDPALPDQDSMLFVKSNPGARFGRNVPLAEAFPDPEPKLLEPSPRRISHMLMARKTFIAAPTLNFLAAAWIQFETHDWFNHGEPLEDRPFDIPLEANDPWRRHSCPMKIRRTRPDPTRDYAAELAANGGTLRYPPTYANAESHWWDGSQIYGSNHQTTAGLRSDYVRRNGAMVPTGHSLPDGKLYLDHDRLILDPAHLNVALTGFAGNWWAGLSLLHTIFIREHNAICDRLKSVNPDWHGDRIFGVARMINSALMAKIHTVEWTPAILGHPALEIGMNANWWGLETERLYRAVGRISENEAFSGMPLSGVDHSGADYCLTEEFVSVYRMHPLMRDDLTIKSATTGATLEMIGDITKGLIGNLGDLTVFDNHAFVDVLYSFGVAPPGAITLHNYPAFLRELRRPDGELVDLASIDVLRDRERGVPRYNRFLRLIHKRPIGSFDDLANPQHPGLPQQLRAVYGADKGVDNVEDLDLIIGLLSETPPPGFGFSDTAFRIFILMASRRLRSDRFIARDFTSDVYTREGIAWVQDNGMVDVLLRHFPELGPALYGRRNAFKPWNDVATKNWPQ